MTRTAELFENLAGETVVVWLETTCLGSQPNRDAIRKVFSCREEAVLSLNAAGYSFKGDYGINCICGEIPKGETMAFWEKTV